MPANLSIKFNINQKKIRLTALFLLSPLFFFAQSLTGLWIGTLTNDSSSVRKDQSFEIALTEYRGKVYGYSRSEFIVNDTLYYVVKRVKGSIDGDMCEVKDDEIISYNFPTRLDKGVKVISTFYRDKKDSTWYLEGKWKTNQTKKYYSVSGKVDLKEEKDLSSSKIFPHLQELNLAEDVAFYKERKKETEPTIVKTVESDNKKSETANKESVTLTTKANTKNQKENTDTSLIEKDTWTNVEVKKREPVSNVSKPTGIPQTERVKTLPAASSTPSLPKNKTDVAIVKIDTKQESETRGSFTNSKVVKTSSVASTSLPNKKEVTVVKTDQSTLSKEPVLVSAKSDTKTTKTTNPETKKSGTASIPDKQDAIVSSKILTDKKEIKNDPATIVTKPENKNEVIIANGAAALITERKSEFSQVVNFKSDSLELALYDNGEVDGDTVSILLNGEIILAKQGLKAVAIKKTIYITPKGEEFNLVLYAENLGKYPPNTGLLVVHDGDDVYNVRFTADFQTNAGIIFRRKQKQ